MSTIWVQNRTTKMLNKISEKEIEKMIATVRRYKKLGCGQKRIVEILKKFSYSPQTDTIFYKKHG
tara:strand:- start:179 stop:373 length:195 start_codon:yes stop_codon:yes gene_type:complete